MSDTTTPYVSDEQIMEMSLVYQSNVGEDDGSPMSTTMRNSASLLHMRDLYEARLSQVIKERDEARERAAWIPVSERLPELNERVLVSDGTSVLETSHNVKGFKMPRPFPPGMLVDVTHWMPLPSPPNTPPSNG